jgi:hypothetical protein
LGWFLACCGISLGLEMACDGLCRNVLHGSTDGITADLPKSLNLL